MTKEIKRVIDHIMTVSQRIIARELPLISEVIRRVNVWIGGIDYRATKSKNADELHEYDRQKVDELKKSLEDINKGA